MSSFWHSLQEMLSCLLLGKSYHHLQSENGSNESTQRSNTTFHFNFFNSLRSYNGVALGSAQRVWENAWYFCIKSHSSWIAAKSCENNPTNTDKHEQLSHWGGPWALWTSSASFLPSSACALGLHDSNPMSSSHLRFWWMPSGLAHKVKEFN